MPADKMFPVLKEEYALHKCPEFGFIYPLSVKTRYEGYLINKDATVIIDRCDGKSDLEEIAGELALHYQEDPDSLFETLKSYLENSETFIEISNEPKHRNFESTGIGKFLHLFLSPLNLHTTVTSLVNTVT